MNSRVMIGKLLILFPTLCIFSSPALAEIWLSGDKKPADNSAQLDNKPVNTPIFVPQDRTNTRIFSDLGAPVHESQAVPSDLHGHEFQNLKPAMLDAGYSPKTQQEILTITRAQHAWQDDAMARMERAAQARIAASQHRSEEALRKLQPVEAMTIQHNYSAPLHSSLAPTSTAVIYNNDAKPNNDVAPVIYNDAKPDNDIKPGI